MPTISKKNIIFLIFGTVKRKNPRSVGKNRRILDQNVVVFELAFDLALVSDHEVDRSEAKIEISLASQVPF